MKRNWHFRIRKLHRYLGLLLGLQFLLWTAGGLYFSWSNMDEIHGDHYRHPSPALRMVELISPETGIKQLRRRYPALAVTSLQIIDVLGESLYKDVYHEKPATRLPSIPNWPAPERGNCAWNSIKPKRLPWPKIAFTARPK